jgi:choline dehydrogenase-like flavoprotein
MLRHRLRAGRQGSITGVVYVRYGAEERQLCRHVFLCAGAVESPRLLLIHGLANSSGQVGRNFMAHTGMQVWGRFEESVRPYKGIPGGLISEDTHRPADADFAGGYLLQSIGVMPLTYVGQVARGPRLVGRRTTPAHARLQSHRRHQHPGRLPAA